MLADFQADGIIFLQLTADIPVNEAFYHIIAMLYGKRNIMSHQHDGTDGCSKVSLLL